MTPKFSRAVDEVFVYVIGLLTRIEQNEELNPAHEKTQIRSLLDRAEAKVESRDEWKLAKYGLVAWIDEALTQAEWKAREWWQERSLENDYFRTGDAGIQFFVQAREAQECTNKDALEVFYVCVMLGFRGVYGGRGGAEYAEQYNLDPNLDAWIERTAIAIKLRQGRPPISGIPQAGSGAPPLEARFQFLGMSLFTLMLVVATVLTGVWFWWSNRPDTGDSNELETSWIQRDVPQAARGIELI